MFIAFTYKYDIWLISRQQTSRNDAPTIKNIRRMQKLTTLLTISRFLQKYGCTNPEVCLLTSLVFSQKIDGYSKKC